MHIVKTLTICALAGTVTAQEKPVASEISADADRAKVSVSPSTRGDAVAWVSAELRAVQADW